MQVNDVEPPEAQLAPPGAGLPFPELCIARLRFWWMRRSTSREEVGEMFASESAKIGRLISGTTERQAGERVLIKRPRGLEDSSRGWSLWMTLEHLRIVNLAVVGTVRSLARGEVSTDLIGTADVKPSPDVTAEVVEEFERSCAMLTRAVAKIDDLNTDARYPHPWFGPLDAAGWFALAAVHLRIHRVQIERILAGARSD